MVVCKYRIGNLYPVVTHRIAELHLDIAGIAAVSRFNRSAAGQRSHRYRSADDRGVVILKTGTGKNQSSRLVALRPTHGKYILGEAAHAHQLNASGNIDFGTGHIVINVNRPAGLSRTVAENTLLNADRWSVDCNVMRAKHQQIAHAEDRSAHPGHGTVRKFALPHCQLHITRHVNGASIAFQSNVARHCDIFD